MSPHPGRIAHSTIESTLNFIFAQQGAGSSKPISLCFFGGEPLMAPDLVAHISRKLLERAALEARNVTFSMTTNGTLMDAQCAELIREFNIKVNLSLDGHGAAQDFHRRQANGKGSFSLIERNIERLTSLPRLSVRLTVSPDTAAMLEESVCWLQEKGFRSIFFSPVVEAAWDYNSLSSLYKAYQNLHRYQKLRPRREARITNLTRDVDRLRNGNQRIYGCGAARNLVAIDTSGNIYPCQRFIGYFRGSPEHHIGNVFNGLDTVRQQHYIEHNTIDNIESCGEGLYPGDLDAANRSGCAKCMLFAVCHAGCMAVNASLTGNPRKPSPVNRLLAQIAASSCLTIFSNTPDETPSSATINEQQGEHHEQLIIPALS
jgi:uncharacterized protein